jgi:hypothetical protein
MNDPLLIANAIFVACNAVVAVLWLMHLAN